MNLCLGRCGAKGDGGEVRGSHMTRAGKGGSDFPEFVLATPQCGFHLECAER